MDTRNEIDKLAWLNIKDKQLLVARSKGKDTYYIPGGKREHGESDQEALIREIREEISVDLISSSIKFGGVFKAQAHDKPKGTMVKITCYFSEFTGEMQANSEIEELRWLSYEETAKCSEVTKIVMDWLKSQNLIESKSSATQQINVDEQKSESKSYEWILFDADETLFQFDAFKGLQLMFSKLSIDFTHQDYQEYQAINKPLWVDYQNGVINAQQLQCQRFNAWSNKLLIPAKDLNTAFLAAMAELCMPLDGAESLIKSLKGKFKLGIITNGFTELQQARLERTGLKDYFDLLVISEQVGFAKPHKGIFDHALAIMGNPPRNRVLMVGDTPESDILGGINSGLDTCWVNMHKKPVPEGIKPHYQVSSLGELECFLLGKKLSLNINASQCSSTMWQLPILQVNRTLTNNAISSTATSRL